MRPVIATSMVLLLASGCPEPEPEPSEPPRCEDCEQHDSCPDLQPSENPLQPCDEMDATCFYCGPVMRRFTCRETSNGELRWQDAGEAEECPPPPEPMTGTAGTG